MSQHRKVDLTQLHPQQLVEFRQSTEEEVTHFTQSLQALQTAQSKLRECIASISQMSSARSPELLIPLTSSLYLPGRAADVQKYLVDIGTGYYVEKAAPEAKAVYEKKIAKLNDDAQKLKDILVQKNDILNTVNAVLRNKVIEMEKSGV